MTVVLIQQFWITHPFRFWSTMKRNDKIYALDHAADRFLKVLWRDLKAPFSVYQCDKVFLKRINVFVRSCGPSRRSVWLYKTTRQTNSPPSNNRAFQIIVSLILKKVCWRNRDAMDYCIFRENSGSWKSSNRRKIKLWSWKTTAKNQANKQTQN